MFQEAARDSATWFENVRRYDGFDPVQFACNLLTRSGRIGHLELTRRDPRSRPPSTASSPAGPELLAPPPPLFAPLGQRAVTSGARVALAVGAEDDADDGRLAPAAAGRLAAAAGSGAGVVVSELVAVAPGGRITPGTPACGPTTRPARGRRWPGRWPGGARPWPCGSATPAAAAPPGPAATGSTGSCPAAGRCWLPRPSPTPRQARSCRRWTVATWNGSPPSSRPRPAGPPAAGVVPLADRPTATCSAGFLSPLANRRGDRFGGPLEGRLRFPLRVVDAVRAAWPADRPLWAALTVTDWAAGGLAPAEAVEAARTLAAHGCDLLQVTAGQTTATTRPDYGRFHLVGWSDLVRQLGRRPHHGRWQPHHRRRGQHRPGRRPGRPVPARPAPLPSDG